jgi:Biopolymer transport protein
MTEFTFRADENVAYGVVAKVMGRLNGAGFGPCGIGDAT